jgi:selenide,water dikinase
VFDGVLEIARFNRSGGMGSNEEYFAAGVGWDPDAHAASSDALRLVFYDPQTSGGLLVAVSPGIADRAEAAMRAAGVAARRVGGVQAAIPHIFIHVI